MRKEEKPKLHENNHSEYIYPDKKAFQDLIKHYKKEDEKTGREKITSSKLAELADMDKEVFRKLLNTWKTTKKRDCIILICILLKMNYDTVNKALAYYGMPILNLKDERDEELIAIVDECTSAEFPIERRMSIKEINNRLLQAGFPELDVINSRQKKQKEGIKAPYKVLEKMERTVAGEITFEDQYDSLSTAYSFQRYQCRANMLLENQKNGERFWLSASPVGEYLAEKFNEKRESIYRFRHYKDIEETGNFKEFFLELQRNAKREQKYMDNLLNDTRNYGERIGAGIRDDMIYIYCEKYNYEIPERNEYYLMEYIKGKFSLSVYEESVFMYKYLSKEKYKEHYDKFDAKVIERYDSFDEILNMLGDKKLSYDKKSILYCRKKAFKRMSETVIQCLEDLKNRVIFIQNFDNVFDIPDEVYRWYKLEKEFDCSYDEWGNICANRQVAEIECFDGKKVIVSFEEIKRAFELGFSDKEQICRIKENKGKIEAIFE